jgi:hypothetical protein
MLQLISVRNFLKAALAVVAISFLLGSAALADTLTYTFSGVGSGTIAGNTNTTFTDASFTATFTENTANITNFGVGSGYFLYTGISGTFTEGSYTTTITGVSVEVNANPSAGGNFESVDLFNTSATNGLGLDSCSVLLGYDLTTPVSTSPACPTNANLTPTLGGSFSTTTGDTLTLTGDDSLDFTAAAAVAAVPEPSTLFLFTTGLSGIGLLRRRFRA